MSVNLGRARRLNFEAHAYSVQQPRIFNIADANAIANLLDRRILFQGSNVRL